MVKVEAGHLVLTDADGSLKVRFFLPGWPASCKHLGPEGYRDQSLEIACGDRGLYRVTVRTGGRAKGVAFDLSVGGQWYGHGFSHRQPFPLNDEQIVNDNFVVNNIQSPVYLASNGSALVVDTYEPIAVHLNSAGSGLLEVCPRGEGLLPLIVLADRDIVAVRNRCVRMLGLPRRTPSFDVFAMPIFSTWTQCPCYISQEIVTSFAREVKRSGFPCNTIEIDEQWEPHFGELVFDEEKFPSPARMIEEIHRMGFNVTLWVSPFVNEDAANFEQLRRERIVVNRKDTDQAAMLRWWHGNAGIIDFTSRKARRWYQERLSALMDLGIDGFKIDGGDGKYQPGHRDSDFAGETTPSAFCDAYVKFFADFAPELAETRTGWRTQGLGLISRQGGKDSHWGLDNGMHAMITLGLQMALMGFAYILPDMIPGRVQTLVSDYPLPTDELFVRWTEVSAFFPVMQFSYLPWNYDSAVVDACRAYAELHRSLAPYIYEAALRARDGEMIVAPLFAEFPDDENCYHVNDEFLLGEDLLVCPVLHEGATSRRLYLPPGRWIDVWTKRSVTGGGYLNDHPAPCPGIPLFVREGGGSEAELFHLFSDWCSQTQRGTISSGVTTTTHEAGIDRDVDVTG